MARDAGLSMIAITDHETVAGVGEALAAGDELGIEVVPGIEFAARMGSIESHLLGLWIDPADDSLIELIAVLQQERRERAEKMVAKLRSLGVDIGMEDVLAAVGKGSIGRPHIAQALANVGAVPEFKAAFKTLIGRDGPAYIPRRHLTPEKAIDVIHGARGAAVLAHGLIGGPQREHVKKIAAMGLDAVEVVHPKLRDVDSAWLREFAAGEGLGITGGSDWHGEQWSEGMIGQYAVGVEEAGRIMAARKTGRGA